MPINYFNSFKSRGHTVALIFQIILPLILSLSKKNVVNSLIRIVPYSYVM